MSQKDTSHSSTQRTVLWTIIPATVFVSLLLTSLNHKLEPPREHMKSDFGVVKTEVKVEAPAMHLHETVKTEEVQHTTPATEEKSHEEHAH